MGKKMKLLEVVKDIGHLNPDLTIYVQQPWKVDSEAILAEETDGGEVPNGMEYFIEVFVAKDFLEDWINSKNIQPSIEDQCSRLIHYAQNDA